MENFINLTAKNISCEHLCCAISDKKHQKGVDSKRAWLEERIKDGHTFRKLNAKGKVFIEYSPLEKAWIPIEGEGFVYIYCLWVAGSFKGKSYGKELLNYCIDEAKKEGKNGVCVVSSPKKTPYLGDKKFFQKFGFEVVDRIGDYELLSLYWYGDKPHFSDNARKCKINSDKLTIYYSPQCPYISNCVDEVKTYCETDGVELDLISIDTLERAKNIPCIFNNWAVFKDGKFVTHQLLNENLLRKILNKG